jgi:UrcA family protein
MTRKLFAVASLCAFLGATFAATPSFAGGDPGEMRVQTGGLNLQSEGGAQSALSRIKYAASVFCEDTPATRDLSRKAEARKCRDRMMYLAVGKLDAPLVTASYSASGAKPPILLATR